MKTKRHFFVTLATCLSVGLTLLASPYFAKAIAGNDLAVALDASFDVGTGPNGPVNTVAVQADGRVLVGGDFIMVNGVRRHSLARLNTNGTVDETFNPNIAASGSYGLSAIAVSADGRVFIGGQLGRIDGVVRNTVARLNADGSLDAGFSSRTTPFTVVAALVLQDDGKLLIGGWGDGNGGDKGRITRLNSDGSVDATFHAPALAFDSLRALVVQTNGLIVAGGTSSQPLGASSRKVLVRLNADGSTDASFNASLEFHYPGPLVEGLALQQDGKLLVSGNIISVGGSARSGVARLNTDGSLDASFDAGGAIYGGQNQVRVLSSGQVLVTGEYVSDADAGWHGVALLNSDGSLDRDFTVNYGISGRVTATAIQQDGNIVIGGQFSSNGSRRPHDLARLFADGVPRHSIGFTFDTFSAAENEGRVTITLERRGDSSGKASVHYATSDGTGTAGVNYVAQSGMVTFAPLQTSNSFTISLIDDGVPLGERTVMISLSDASEGVMVGPIRTASLVIEDTEIPASADSSFQAELPPPTITLPRLASSFNIYNLLVQPDGKILLGGATNHDFTRYSLVRLNPNGPRDASFTARFESANREYASVYSLVRQVDGKFLAAGVFSKVNGVARHSPVRLNTDGSLDTSFVSALGEEAELLAVQPNGKILASGISDHAWMQRLNTDGSNDPTFNIGFRSGPGSQITSINALSSGKILLAVTPGVELVLLDSDGSVDIRFQPGRFESPDLYSDATIECVQVLSSGNILVGGHFSSIGSFPRNGLARLNADGSMDTAFDPHIADAGNDRRRYDRVNAIALQTNGQLIISGSFEAIAGFSRPGLARLNSDGSLDQNYFAPGNFGWNSQMALQPNDQLLIAWGPMIIDAFPRGNLTRLNADANRPVVLFHAAQFADSEASDHADIRVDRIGDIRSPVTVSYSTSDGSAKAGQDYQAVTGTLDFAAFETRATFSVPLIDNVADNSDQTVQIALTSPSPGTTLGLSRAELTIADNERPGSLDVSFHWLPNTNYLCEGSEFYLTSPIALQADGKILANSCAPNSPIRLNANGSFDLGFRPLLSGNFYHPNLILQPDGKILVQSDTGLVRLNPDGSPDTGFTAPSFPNGGLSGAIMQYSDQPIVFGQFVVTNGLTAKNLARLDHNGALDANFLPSLEAHDMRIVGVVAQPDGRLVILSFNSRIYQDPGQLIRLLPDGSRDASFITPPVVEDHSPVMALQPDGKLLITQVFPGPEGSGSYSGLIRLDVDGSQDNSFISLRLGPTGYGSRAIVVQPDGKIIVGGAGPYYESSDVLRSGIARLNADGSLDTTFDVGLGLFDLSSGLGIASADVSALALQPDGQVLIGGYFTSFNGIPAIGLARLNGDSSPRFESISALNTGGVRLGVNVRPGRTVVIEASTDLRQWVPLHTNTTSSANFEYAEPGVTGTPHRFYRAVRH